MKTLSLVLTIIAFLITFTPLQAQNSTVKTIEVESFATQSGENNSIRNAAVVMHSGMSADSFVQVYGAAEYVRVSDSVVIKMYRAHGLNYKKHANNGKMNLHVLRTPLKRVVIKTSKTVDKATYTRKSTIDTYLSKITVEKDTIVSVDTVTKKFIKLNTLKPVQAEGIAFNKPSCNCEALYIQYTVQSSKQQLTNRSVIEIKQSHKTALAYNKYARCKGLKTINLGRRPKNVSKRVWNSNSWLARQILRVKSHRACRKV